MFNLEALYIILNKKLHYLYLLFAIPLVYFSVVTIPPFQNPDEPNHFARAEQVSRLELVPHFVYDNTGLKNADGPDFMAVPAGGFVVDKGVFETARFFAPIAHQISVKVTPADFDNVKNVKWQSGKTLTNFANTAIYAPVGYVAAALGIAAGKTIHLSVIKTIYLARFFNAAFSVTICFFALLLAKRSKILLFTALLFPMTITLFASVSQDAILVSCAFLLGAIIDSIESSTGKNYTKRGQWLMILLMCIISVAKPPYLPLAFTFLFLKLDRKSKFVSIITPVVLVAAWTLLSLPNFSIRMPETDFSVNPKLQFMYICYHPFKFISLFFKFNAGTTADVLKMFVGILGWRDVAFPSRYYTAAYLVIILAAATTLNMQIRDNFKLRLGLFLSAFVTLLAILTSQYISFTAVAAGYLGGMQGRYLTPIFPFVALAICFSSTVTHVSRFKMLALWVVLLFPVFTAINLVHVLSARYYLN
jgi:uncharacterized membrane protein